MVNVGKAIPFGKGLLSKDSPRGIWEITEKEENILKIKRKIM